MTGISQSTYSTSESTRRCSATHRESCSKREVKRALGRFGVCNHLHTVVPFCTPSSLARCICDLML